MIKTHTIRKAHLGFYSPGRLYALQNGMEIDKKSPDCRVFFVALMDYLENVRLKRRQFIIMSVEQIFYVLMIMLRETFVCFSIKPMLYVFIKIASSIVYNYPFMLLMCIRIIST